MGTRTKTNSRKRDILVEQRNRARALAARLFVTGGNASAIIPADVSSLTAWAQRYFPGAVR